MSSIYAALKNIYTDFENSDVAETLIQEISPSVFKLQKQAQIESLSVEIKFALYRQEIQKNQILNSIVQKSGISMASHDSLESLDKFLTLVVAIPTLKNLAISVKEVAQEDTPTSTEWLGAIAKLIEPLSSSEAKEFIEDFYETAKDLKEDPARENFVIVAKTLKILTAQTKGEESPSFGGSFSSGNEQQPKKETSVPVSTFQTQSLAEKLGSADTQEQRANLAVVYGDKNMAKHRQVTTAFPEGAPKIGL